MKVAKFSSHFLCTLYSFCLFFYLFAPVLIQYLPHSLSLVNYILCFPPHQHNPHFSPYFLWWRKVGDISHLVSTQIDNYIFPISIWVSKTMDTFIYCQIDNIKMYNRFLTPESCITKKDKALFLKPCLLLIIYSIRPVY